ncbi:hypothetical protein Hamer_G002364 [Homarus americanus]|uniref:Uncharacterized protein n=1 Tax=Homarus americanus TaxID=6706 RepID=A0A8J5KEP8_HOMAM|nr:hypothetical protein Hamer_G002364 [Homarus americanus]
MVGVALLLVALVAGSQAELAGVGPGGGGGGGGYGGYGGYGGGCYPQTHYETHYRKRLQEVPVYETVVSQTVVLQPFTEVVYSTIFKQNIQYVSHRYYTETVESVIYVPDYSTSTRSVTQYQPVEVTSHLYTTEVSPYDFPTPYVETIYNTVTDAVTITHRSQVPHPTTYLVTKTYTDYYTEKVTLNKLPYTAPQEIVVVTNNIVNVKPTHVTKTYHVTQRITTTNVERVPYTVTHTVPGQCGPSGYSYPEPHNPLQYAGSNVNSVVVADSGSPVGSGVGVGAGSEEGGGY